MTSPRTDRFGRLCSRVGSSEAARGITASLLLALVLSGTGCPQPPIRLPPHDSPCTISRNGEDSITESTARAGTTLAHIITTVGANRVKGHVTVSMIDQPILDVEFQSAAKGQVEIQERVGGPSGHLLKLRSVDGISLNGTLDGRALESIPIDKARDFVDSKGLRYSDGSAVTADPVPSETIAAIHDSMTALKTNLAACPVAKKPAGSAPDPSGNTGPLRDPPPSPAQTESPGQALPCIASLANCGIQGANCVVAAFVGATGCALWYWVCAAAGLATCTIVAEGCLLYSYVPGQGCCPVDCGWPQGCCLQGHTCVDRDTHQCCALRCGSGCCNEGDTCFNDFLGAAQCCPRGMTACPGPQGGSCCAPGENCNALTGRCCAANEQVCGAAGCCLHCNATANPPACCTGNDPCGPCGHLGEPCCAGGSPCPGAVPSAGCSAGRCVACAQPPRSLVPPNTIAHNGADCGGTSHFYDFGQANCDSGFQLGTCAATLNSAANGSTCSAVPLGGCMCRVTVTTPRDCSKWATCGVVVTETPLGPPPTGCP